MMIRHPFNIIYKSGPCPAEEEEVGGWRERERERNREEKRKRKRKRKRERKRER
jgi:hypothetical protein